MRCYEPDNWLLRAACRDADPNIFYPKGMGRPRSDRNPNPRDYCNECPVTRQCLERALRNPVTLDRGIWANTNESQRKALRRQRNAQAS